MKLEMPEKNYIQNIPFEAELSRIHMQMPHFHPKSLELIYCLEGTVHLIAADQDYDIFAGDVATVDNTDVHYISSDKDNLVLVFHINVEEMDNWDEIRYVFFACETQHCFPYQQEAMNRVKDLILTLSYHYFMGFPGAKSDYLGAVNQLSDILLKYFNWYNFENQDEHMNEDLHRRFARVLDYVMKNYQSKITVSYLAEKEHLNRAYFSQFISKTIFTSFSSMVNYVRCFHAELLLLETDKSIADIAYECGFSDAKYLYKAFQELWHTTPRTHRQKYRKYYEKASKEQNLNITITGDTAAAIIRNYIVKWHFFKSFSWTSS